MQESMNQIKQDRVVPANDPEPPTVLKKHLYHNPDILTQSEKAIPHGSGTAVVGDVDPLITADTLLGMGFLKQQPDNFKPNVSVKD
jgi:hypothetical protein